jgi:hypothetical protein
MMAACMYCGQRGLRWFEPTPGKHRLGDQWGFHSCDEGMAHLHSRIDADRMAMQTDPSCSRRK